MRLAFFLFMTIAVNTAFAADSSSSAASALASLILEGHELHASLKTPGLDDKPIRHVSRGVLQSNPQHSTDTEFVKAIARSGSQGNLNAEGVRAALYALYHGENELGFYGLEAASVADANRLEAALRKIWSHNASIGRARVHRSGLALVVVWTDGVSPDTWEAVNTIVASRLTSH